MNKERIKKFIGNTDMTIVEVMEKIDVNAKGILFIIDKKEILVGCITDGDIRRWLLKTGNLYASVINVMTPSPKFLFEKEKSKAKNLMQQKKITALPLLDEGKKIIDIVLISEIAEKEIITNNKNLTGIPVVIMAGGKGTRLYPFTKILPKPLIPIEDTPIIERIINCFTDYKINKYYVTVNYKKSMIKAYFSEINPEYIIEFVEENKPLGTSGSLKLINERFDKPLFVTNCDSLVFTDYSDLYQYHKESDNSITIVSALKNITVPYGVLYSKENGELINMEEKPKLSYFINTGMYVINPDIINIIPNNKIFHMTHLIENVMKIGGKVGMYPISENSFLDMGEFSEMQRMEEKLKSVSN